ncbi:MAG: Arm DNA-binding domain-containing protein, partial [Gammaproteobacteria bacterium]
MKGNLIQRTIDSIKPKSKPYEIWDEKLTGFLVRVQPSGHLSYVVQYRHNKRLSLGKCSLLTPGQARDAAFELISMARKGASDDEIKRAARPVEGLT